MIQTYYTILGIKETATTEEVRNAYITLFGKFASAAQRGDAIAIRIIETINKAYEVLSDVERRKKYDYDLMQYKNEQSADAKIIYDYKEYIKQKYPQPSQKETNTTDRFGWVLSSICIVGIAVTIISLFIKSPDAQTNNQQTNKAYPSKQTVVNTEPLFRRMEKQNKEIFNHQSSQRTNSLNGQMQILHNTINNPPPVAHKPVSKYVGNRLVNGASPYLNYWQSEHDESSLSKIEFINETSLDFIVILYDIDYHTVIRHNYIRAGSSFTMRKLPEGRYKMKSYAGKDWNPTQPAIEGAPNGKFEKDEFLEESRSKYDFNIQFETKYEYDEYDNLNRYVEYPSYTMTLHKVQNGNMTTQEINKAQFFTTN